METMAMPIQKNFKRRVRARMRKTGESYTAARARLLEKRPARAPRASRASTGPAASEPDLAAQAGMADAVVAKKTGRTWKQWASALDRAGAAGLSHTEIARIVHERFEVPGWWSQTVTVGYERMRGLREKGQRRDGTFEVNKSKTYSVPLAELWKGFCRCDVWLVGGKLRMSRAQKHKTMRMRWSDGSPVEAYFTEKGPAKSAVTLQHRKLASRAEAARLRAFWAERLAALGELLAAERAAPGQ
jgi:hypothetical protein